MVRDLLRSMPQLQICVVDIDAYDAPVVLHNDSRGFGRRMHLGVEITESSTNKQHHLSTSFYVVFQSIISHG